MNADTIEEVVTLYLEFTEKHGYDHERALAAVWCEMKDAEAADWPPGPTDIGVPIEIVDDGPEIPF